jgi:hypothetical protein
MLRWAWGRGVPSAIRDKDEQEQEQEQAQEKRKVRHE